MPLWLLVNARSGSFSEASVAALEDVLRDHGMPVARRICFPEDDLPDAEELERANIARLAVYTGDGTLNAAITRLYGWGGAIMVLPGGTMNLLANRLHGDGVEADEIVARIAAGAARAVRPRMARCPAGDALAGLLVGPGTAWANVREAMRDFDLPGLARGTSDAVADTTGGAMVRCDRPALGRSEGYPLIEITPSHRGLQLDAFYAEGPADYLQQGFALLRRRFREGPHDRLGLIDEVALRAEDDTPLPVLIDGEPGEVESGATFTVATCEVDLLATDHGY